jgi:histidine triad (HIT) family protein
MDCLFCKIIRNETPCITIYEDDDVKAFLDINPATNGHTLVVPKKHFDNFLEVDDALILHMNNVIKKLYTIYKEKLHCEGLTICHNTDYGQAIKHFHIHFIPRYNNDKVDLVSNKELLNNLEEIQKRLSN